MELNKARFLKKELDDNSPKNDTRDVLFKIVSKLRKECSVDQYITKQFYKITDEPSKINN